MVIDNDQKIVYDENTKCVGLARVGSKTQKIVYGTMNELLNIDFGEPLHSFVIPGHTHFIEEDVLKMYETEIINDDDNDIEEKQEEKEEEEEEKEEEWNGIDFNGIWQLEKSDNLDNYLLSEGWSIIQRKAASKSSITQQIIQNKDEMKIKIFYKNGNYSYNLRINGESTMYKDLNKDSCESIAKWSDNKKYIMETISKKSQITNTQKEYTAIRGIVNENGSIQMTLKYINDRGVSVTRYFKKL